jgi:hypothetical protein
MPDLLDHFFVCFDGPGQHDQEKQPEYRQRRQAINADPADLLDIMYKFHSLIFI